MFGDVTTGAENDLVEATRLTRRMVTRWGMGELGLAAFQTDEEHPFLGYELSKGRDYSEITAAAIDKNVRELLDERHDAVRQLLVEQRDKLDKLAEALLHKETIEQEEITEILGVRPNATSTSGVQPEAAGKNVVAPEPTAI